MKVLAGISGGVDSAVAALILKQQGYDVIGAMMKIYDGKIKNPVARSCYGSDKKQEIEDAKKNCKLTGIDFQLIDCTKEFDEFVFKIFKTSYLNGKTPNPCVLCNPTVKFGVFPELAKKNGLEFEKFATGHYARIEYDKNTGKYLLKRASNLKKDQSYFLYGLKQEQLKNILFPLGNMTKEQVRQYAKLNGLPVSDKIDSQDFYKGDYGALFETPKKEGKIIDKHGNVLGYHKGIFNFTTGQRKGLMVAYSEPLYVIELDAKENLVVVGTKKDTFSKGLIAQNVNWTHLNGIKEQIKIQAKIRGAQQPFDCTAEPHDEGVKIIFDVPQSAVTKGQSVVMYDGDTVLGGGIIKEAIN